MSTPNSNIKWPHLPGDKRPFFGPDLALQPPKPWAGPWEQTDTKSRKRRRDEDEKAVIPPHSEPESVFDYSNTTHAFYLAQQAHLACKVRVTPALLANQNSQHFRISDIGDHFISWLSINLHWLWEEYVVRAVHWRRAKGTVDTGGRPRHCKHIDAAQRVKLIWLKQDVQRKLDEQNAQRRELLKNNNHGDNDDDSDSSNSSSISNGNSGSDSSSDSDFTDYNPPRAQMPVPQVLPPHLIPTPVPRPVRSKRPSTGPPRPTVEPTQTSNAFAAALKTDRMPRFPVQHSTSTDTKITRQHPPLSTPAPTKTSSAFAAALGKGRFSKSPAQSNTSTPTGIAGQAQGSVPEETSVQRVTVGQSAPFAPSAQLVDDTGPSSSRPAAGPAASETPATETAKPETGVESSSESGSEAGSESDTDEPKSEPSPWRNVFGNPGLWLDPKPAQNTGFGNSILAKKRPTASAAQSNPADIPTATVGENTTSQTGDVLPARTETTQAAQTGVRTASTQSPQTEPLQIQPPQTQPRRSARLEQLQQARTEASQPAQQTVPYALASQTIPSTPASQTIPSQPATQTEATRPTESQQSLPAQSQPPSNQQNATVPQPPPGFFPCPRCTYHNAVTDTWCTACGTLFSNFTSMPGPAQQYMGLHQSDEAIMHDFKIDLIHKRFADGEQRFRSWWNTSSMTGDERELYKRAIREINADAQGWHYRGSEVRPMDTRVDPLDAVEDVEKLARWKATVERLREAGLGVPENIKGWYEAKPGNRHRTWWELERLDADDSVEEEPLTEEQRLMILAVDREALVAVGLDTPENLPNWDGMTEEERDQVLRDWESLEEQGRMMEGGL